MARSSVIILGNDHTNTLGLVQSAAMVGYEVYAAVWGLKTGMVKRSRYLSKKILGGQNANECVERILNTSFPDNNPIPILCSCDGAALAVERYKTDLAPRFICEHTNGAYSINELQEKSLQVALATKAGFNVPESFIVIDIHDIEERRVKITFPCIFKALKSVEGDKGDLTICSDYNELHEKAKLTLRKTPRILVQQYIERDYEISILGCGLNNGECVIPCVEDKLTLFPKNVGLECLARIKPLENVDVIDCISELIRITGYVGLFSVEMMHSKTDDKFYFTEINLRNDGAQSFIRKYGINLPLIHIKDLRNEPWQLDDNFNPGYYLWEIHHFYSMLHRDIAFGTWFKEIIKAKGGLVFEWKDLKPFIRQFTFPVIGKFKKPQFY